jgi:hypothetical protein
MPITLKDLQSLRRTITVETAAGELNVTYRLGAITPAARAEFDRPGIAGLPHTWRGGLRNGTCWTATRCTLSPRMR